LEQNGTPVEKFSHHAFRDTFATRYIQNGGTLQTLKTILGHSSFAMTADLYAHVMPNTKQDEMNLIEKGFQGVV
jgi:integrase